MTLPPPDEKARVVRTMFDRIAPRYDRMNRLLTFGMDIRWRRRTVADLRLDPPARVLDLACGTGDLSNDLAAAGHRPIGVDLSGGMLAAATTSAPLVHGDILELPVPDASVDGAVCGFALRNVVALDDLFAELARVLRPGGRVGLLEVAEPSNGLLRAGHDLYFNRVVPFVGGLLSDRTAYRYLPDSVAYLPPVAEMLDMLRSHGFDDVERTALSGGIAQLITATRTR